MSSSSSSDSSNNCIERVGNGIETSIFGFFSKVGLFIGNRPKITIALSILLTIACGAGFTQWTTESRPEKLWVPQDTEAEQEQEQYTEYFDSNIRFNNILVQAASSSDNNNNVLTKEILTQAMDMHYTIQTKNSTADIGNDDEEEKESITSTLLDLCARGGNACTGSSSSDRGPICNCLLRGILGQWNFDPTVLAADDDVLTTLNTMNQTTLLSLLGNPTIDETTGTVTAAEAFRLDFFLEGRLEIVNNAESDPLNDAWEESVFLATAESNDYPLLQLDYFAARSFGDEFGSAITGDLALVNISYIVVFLFLGATLGKIMCGTGSRWTMSLAALVTVGLSVGAGFGVSSLVGLFFGPVHSLLPFILIGIGVDDAFVIVNAFNRERAGVKRSSEDNRTLAQRAARSLGRAGASITVTSATDLVAFAISSTSALPALASFCGYAAICIFFLWFFASTFFTGCLVLDERRQRDGRFECICCFPREPKALEDDDDNDATTTEEEEEGYQEGFLSKYFRQYHAPTILSPIGKVVVLLGFAGLFGFGLYGAINLPVEDTQRAFIPSDSYVTDWLSTTDEYFPAAGISVAFVFENAADIYNSREALAQLDTRLSGRSTASPWIAEPVPDVTYSNVMAEYKAKLADMEDTSIVTLGDDGWPTTVEDFESSLQAFVTNPSMGGMAYIGDVAFADGNSTTTSVTAIQIKSEYVGLTKTSRDDEIIDDADRQIDAMDDTRIMVDSWTDLPPNRFVYSEKFIAIEGFKVIKKELFLNVGLALGAVALIVLLTVASPMTALLITIAVAMCLIEILGFMYLLGIAIDSVSVINLVLAVGLSVDYSAHVGHCFMVKAGADTNARATEALADIGAAVLSGATSTFLAVVVLLFSSSYVFSVLSKQFALTVGLGVLHGLVLLPVLLSICGPKPFASASAKEANNKEVAAAAEDEEDVVLEPTNHVQSASSSSDSSSEEAAAATGVEVELTRSLSESDGSCSC